jgi:hypothetical protein
MSHGVTDAMKIAGQALYALLKPDTAIKVSIVYAVFAIVFSLVVIKDFSHPISGGGDVDYAEYTGFYVHENFHCFPLPHLDLVNNKSCYPYGTNQVFHPWSLEKDLLYALLYGWFGIGPWLQFYFLMSILIMAVGTCLLLHTDYGLPRAAVAGFLVTVFNFYMIHKYPGHFSLAVVHWTVLNIVADFLLVKKIIAGQPVRLLFILVKIALMVLALGQELAYVTGFALMSFTIAVVYIGILLGYRFFVKKDGALFPAISRTIASYGKELVNNPWRYAVLATAIIVASFLYLPLCWQIFTASKSFDLSKIQGSYYAHQVRLLIPYLPFFNPGQKWLASVYSDSPEGFGAGSPGWFLLTIAALGLWQSRKRLMVFVPLLVMFLLCFSYNPSGFPVLKIFPWFALNRVQGRCTLIYPVICCLLAIDVRFPPWQSLTKRIGAAALIILACTEVYTAYSYKRGCHPGVLEKDFLPYMEYVKARPGEAVFDWPFCLVGGNGVGTAEGFASYFARCSSLGALRRFHGKKVMGQYFGRLHPSQMKPYLDAGWNNLFLPDTSDIFVDAKQKRNFRPDEWRFIEDFFRLNDFAGINLCVDLLPQDCIGEFYQRFGRPVIETRFAPVGRMQFIPKAPGLRKHLNPDSGLALKFEPFLDFKESSLIDFNRPYGLQVSGISDRKDDGKFRWGMEPVTTLIFRLQANVPLIFHVAFINRIPHQTIAIEHNGNTVATIADLQDWETIDRTFTIHGTVGTNTVAITYRERNHGTPSLNTVIFLTLDLKQDTTTSD